MIYADYNGSSPLVAPVREYLHKRIDSDLFANPNAIHSMGQKVAGGIEKCREIIARVMACHPSQIIFNSGSSEGVSHIFHSVLEYAPANKKVVITSGIEHSVIPNGLKFYRERRGFEVKYVSVNNDGVVELASLKKLLEDNKDKVALVTIMAANNETGVLQPYPEMASLCQQYGVEFFADTTQLLGKGEFNFEQSGMDYAVCSGHKIGALSGTGFVIAKDPTRLHSLVFGSTQEKGLRGGTQHYLGIETLAVAMQYFHDTKSALSTLNLNKLKFEAEIKKRFPEVVIFGSSAPRLAGTTLISYPGVHSQAVQIELESQDIFVTTSAACTDNQPETSKVLKEMGVNDQVGRGVIRISLSTAYGEKEYALLVDALTNAYNKLIKIKSY